MSPIPAAPRTRILGIDPGSVRTGIGIVDAGAGGHCVHVHHEALQVANAGDFSLRLKAIWLRLGVLIDRFAPQQVAIERVFVARNPDSALKLGQARGAAICAVVTHDLPVHEYSPMQIKNAVVGRGAADKRQVQHMVGVLLNLREKLQADAADALAVAITHAHAHAFANRSGAKLQLPLRRRGRR